MLVGSIHLFLDQSGKQLIEVSLDSLSYAKQQAPPFAGLPDPFLLVWAMIDTQRHTTDRGRPQPTKLFISLAKPFLLFFPVSILQF